MKNAKCKLEQPDSILNLHFAFFTLHFASDLTAEVQCCHDLAAHEEVGHDAGFFPEMEVDGDLGGGHNCLVSALYSRECCGPGLSPPRSESCLGLPLLRGAGCQPRWQTRHR